MQNDLISRSALRKLYSDWIPQLALPADERDKKAIEICIAVLDEAPSIDPESLRPKGRWVRDCEGDEYCENCSRYMPCREVTGDPSAHNYCPNCGAKMEG